MKHYLISLKRISIALHGLKPHNKKALGFLREPIAIVAEWVGVANPVRGKPSNDLAKIGKQQFVVIVLL